VIRVATRRSTVLADVRMGRRIAGVGAVVRVGASADSLDGQVSSTLTMYVLLPVVALATLGYAVSGGCLCGLVVGGVVGAAGGGWVYSMNRKSVT
jgi:hypothetical protein